MEELPVNFFWMTVNMLGDLFTSLPELLNSPQTKKNRPLYFFNTLTRKSELFVLPAPAKKVRMYNCGPTVYDRQHIGNLSAAVFGDTIRRVLEYNGFPVQQVINITDFGHLVSDGDDGEDKMSKGLKREGLTPSMDHMRDLGTKYMNIYLEDIHSLNVEIEKITFPRASDYVPAMIAMIETMEEKSYAYTTSDGVYFDTARFANYGALGGIANVEQQAGARVKENSEKRSPADFALWKVSGKGSKKIGWDSPWGKGFPGWHLECSAMINSILGKQIDIHTGGIEHIAVHHNNEIAQSEVTTGKRPFSRFWMHREHIRMGDAKLAKSSGNVSYLSDVIDRGIHPVALRYWFLTSHYRTPSNFTWEALMASQQALVRLHEKMRDVRSDEMEAAPAKFLQAFSERVNDDLDTAGAIAVLWDAVKNPDLSPSQLHAALLGADAVLGLSLEKPDERLLSLLSAPQMEQIPEEIRTLLEKRETARKEKRWTDADKARDEIMSLGYRLEDSAEGPRVFKQ